MLKTWLSIGMWTAVVSMPLLTPSFAAPGPGDTLGIEGGQRTSVLYDCGGAAGKKVIYINAEANSLAILNVEGKQRIFVNVISASGARYASGQYIWWSKGREASLYDEMKGPDAPAVLECHERR